MLTTPLHLNLCRRGTIAPLLAFALVVCLAAFAFAANKSWLYSVREDLRSAADAAALAAAAELVSDDWLRNSVDLLPAMFERAEAAAQTYAAANPVRGQPLALVSNPTNDRAGDVAFGVLTTPRAGDFTTVPPRWSPALRHAAANTVAVAARLRRDRGTAVPLIFGALVVRPTADVQAFSAATVDRGVRGFRPLYGPVPLAPVALLSDPAGVAPPSWEAQVEAGTGPDAATFQPSAGGFNAAPDGIHEFHAVYPVDPSQLAEGNVAVLQLGNADGNRRAPDLLAGGMTAADFLPLGGQLVLPEVAALDLPALPVALAPELPALVAALEYLRTSAAVRVWPLYRPSPTGGAAITGFVAARVVSVTPASSPEQPLRFTLQATMTARPDALTDTDLRGGAATMNGNRYVAKVRRID